MQKKKRHSLSVLAIVLFISFISLSCSFGSKDKNPDSLTVTSWNVQNMFNSVQDGNEYSEFLLSSGWTEQQYKRRLANLETVFNYKEICDTDVFVLNEIENDDVVKDIMNLKSLKTRGFIYYATAGESRGAIRIAVISRIPIVKTQVHSVEGARPILVVELQNVGEHVFVIALHAKSNLEGVEVTSPLRLKQAKEIKRISDEIQTKNPGSLVIAAGDFNESYKDRNMMCDSRNYTLSCPLRLLPEFKSGYWYCPWLDSKNNMQAPGSYYYNGDWKHYDNTLVSSQGKDNAGWEFASCGVVFHGILQTTDLKPNVFRRDLLTGVSDHLPVWIKFTAEQ